MVTVQSINATIKFELNNGDWEDLETKVLMVFGSFIILRTVHTVYLFSNIMWMGLFLLNQIRIKYVVVIWWVLMGSARLCVCYYPKFGHIYWKCTWYKQVNMAAFHMMWECHMVTRVRGQHTWEAHVRATKPSALSCFKRPFTCLTLWLVKYVR